MNKNQNVEDDFLAGLDNGAADPFDTTAADDLFPEEEGTELAVATEAKPLPFNQDPKIQRYLDKEIKSRMGDYRPTATETFAKEATSGGDEKIVSALTRLVGDDTPEKRAVLADLKSAFGDLKGQAKQEAIQEFIASQENSENEYEEEVSEAKDELEEGFDDIESQYGIQLNNKQKDAFKSFLIKMEPKGGYIEYPDFVESFEVFKNYVKANRPSNSQAKALASRGMERSSSNSSDSAPALKRQGTKSLWQTLDQMM